MESPLADTPLADPTAPMIVAAAFFGTLVFVVAYVLLGNAVQCRREGAFSVLGARIASPLFGFIASGVMVLVYVYLASSLLTDLRLETRVDKLWIAEGGTTEANIKYVETFSNNVTKSAVEVLLLVPSEPTPRENVLEQDVLEKWLNVSEAVAQIEVSVGGRTYSTNDVCQGISDPYAFPCLRPNVLDCFSEGVFDFPEDNIIKYFVPIVSTMMLQIATQGTSMVSGFMALMFKGTIVDYRDLIVYLGTLRRLEAAGANVTAALEAAGVPDPAFCEVCVPRDLEPIVWDVDTYGFPSNRGRLSNNFPSDQPNTVAMACHSVCVREAALSNPEPYAENFAAAANLTVEGILEIDYPAWANHTDDNAVLQSIMDALPAQCAWCDLAKDGSCAAACASSEEARFFLDTVMPPGMQRDHMNNALFAVVTPMFLSMGLSEDVLILEDFVHPFATRPSFRGMNASAISQVVSDVCQYSIVLMPDLEKELVLGGVQYGNATSSTSASSPRQILGASALEAFWLTITPEALVTRLTGPYAARYRPGGALPQSEITLEVAKEILAAWRHKLQGAIPSQYPEERVEVHSIASSSLDEAVAEYSQGSVPLMAAGYGLLLAYSGLTLLNWKSVCRVNPLVSITRLVTGVVGVLLVAIAVAAGVGLANSAGIRLNATSTQVLPFLLLGLGVDDMFVLAHSFPRFNFDIGRDARSAAAYALGVAGPSCTLASAVNTAVFAIGTLARMPIVTAFALQAVAAVVLNYFMTLIVFTYVLSLDYRMQQWGERRVRRRFNDTLGAGAGDGSSKSMPLAAKGSAASLQSRASAASKSVLDNDPDMHEPGCVTRNFTRAVLHPVSKALILLTFGGLIGAAAYSANTLVEEGLELAEVLPAGTPLSEAVKARFEHFPFYPFEIVGTENDYSTREAQVAVVDMFEAVFNTSKVMRPVDTVCWQQLFVEWGLGGKRHAELRSRD